MKRIVAVLKAVGLLGIFGGWFDKRFRFLIPCYFLAVVLEMIWKSKQRKQSTDQENEVPELRHYYTSMAMSFLNPFNFILLIKQVLGQFIVQVSTFRLPRPASFQSNVQYVLPFQGIWKVGRGGVTEETSHSWSIYAQRYAYDFYMVGENDAPFSNNGKQLDDYYCFNQNVLAPADGIVVRVQNNIPDYTGVGDLSIDWKSHDFRGNHIMIAHSDSEFSFLAHFKQKSIIVNEGDTVKRGQLLGQCGNSGHSTMPHLHFHVQNKRNFWLGIGLPVKFGGISIDGIPQPESGQFIAGNQLVNNLIRYPFFNH